MLQFDQKTDQKEHDLSRLWHQICLMFTPIWGSYVCLLCCKMRSHMREENRWLWIWFESSKCKKNRQESRRSRSRDWYLGLGGGNSNMFGIFAPKLFREDEAILTFKGVESWNHQLDIDTFILEKILCLAASSISCSLPDALTYCKFNRTHTSGFHWMLEWIYHIKEVHR